MIASICMGLEWVSIRDLSRDFTYIISGTLFEREAICLWRGSEWRRVHYAQAFYYGIMMDWAGKN